MSYVQLDEDSGGALHLVAVLTARRFVEKCLQWFARSWWTHARFYNFGGLMTVQSPPNQNFMQLVTMSQLDLKSRVGLW